MTHFDTEQQADDYGRWLKNKVERVLSGNGMSVPHEDVAARAAKRRKEKRMNTALKLDPLVSEFDTAAEAENYDRWFRAKVEKSMNGTEPNLSHDEATAFVRAELERRNVSENM